MFNYSTKHYSTCNQHYILSAIILVSQQKTVISKPSASHQPVISQSSASHQPVISQSSASHQPVISQ
jgi:hypothetical protein